MDNRWQVQTAKARFSEFLERSLDEGPQIVTRRGVEAAGEGVEERGVGERFGDVVADAGGLAAAVLVEDRALAALDAPAFGTSGVRFSAWCSCHFPPAARRAPRQLVVGPGVVERRGRRGISRYVLLGR